MILRPVAAGPLVVLLIVLSAGRPALAQDAPPPLGAAPADTLALAVAGVVTGLAWLGPESLAVLAVDPDPGSGRGDPHVRLVVQDTAGHILRESDFTGILARGLAYDGRFLWACGDADDGSSLLYQVLADSLQVSAVFDLPGHRPGGVCFDGEFLWVADRDSGRLDRCDPRTGTVTRSVVAPAFSPFGMAWDGRAAWLADSGTGRLYHLEGPRLAMTGVVGSESFSYRGRDVVLGHDGACLWFVPPMERFAVRLVFP